MSAARSARPARTRREPRTIEIEGIIMNKLQKKQAALARRHRRVRGKIAGTAARPRVCVTRSNSNMYVQVIDDVAGKTICGVSTLGPDFKATGKSGATVEGAAALDRLEDGAHILICEGCTHHRQCGDIGTEKLPAWIRKHTGKELRFSFTSGTEFPDDLSPYSLIIHCGGCMLNAREMKYRLKCAEDQQIPMTNYGIAIAHMNGILKRSVEPFPDIREML